MKVDLGGSGAGRLAAETARMIEADLDRFAALVRPGELLDTTLRIEIDEEDQTVALSVGGHPYRYSTGQARQAASLATGTPGLPALTVKELWPRVLPNLDAYVIELARSVTTEHPELLLGANEWRGWLASCPKSVVIAVEPAYLRDVTKAAGPDDEGIVGQISAQVSQDLGLPLPEFDLVVDGSLAPATFVLWLNQVPLTAYVGLAPNTLFTILIDGPEQLPVSRSIGYRARGSVQPDDRMSATVESDALAIDPIQYLTLALAAQLQTHAHWLMDERVAERMMAQIEEYYAITARATLELTSSAALAEVLADLLADSVPLRQLHVICEGLLEARTRVPAADRAPVRLVRDRLATTITSGASEPGPLSVMVLESTFTADFELAEDVALDELCASLRNAIDLFDGMDAIPTLLVTEDMRLLLRESLRVAVPEVRVMAFDDVPSRQNLAFAGRAP